MTSNIVLPTLSSWAESHVTNLFTATGDSFDQAFSEFMAADVETIIVNGQKLTKDQFKDKLQSAKPLEQSAQVQFAGVVEVQSPDQGERAGDVGLFVNATVVEKLYVFGAPETEAVTISFNLKITPDPTIKAPTGPIKGYYDPRRVSALTSVFTNVQSPIRPPISVPPLQPATSS